MCILKRNRKRKVDRKGGDGRAIRRGRLIEKVEIKEHKEKEGGDGRKRKG